MKTEIKRDHVGKESLKKCFDWFKIRFLREAIKKLPNFGHCTSMNVWTNF